MWRSCLLVNVGDNPDRPRPGRTWLRNLYHVHQRLCMAFPSDCQQECDPLFLKPFNPQGFDGQVHGVERSAETGFLFRIDPQPGGRVVIVVHSALRPKWHYAFQNADYLLREFLLAPPQAEQFDPFHPKGHQLRFRIRIALSDKKKNSTDGRDLRKFKEGALDRYGRPKSQSKRVALSWDENQDPQNVIQEWFAKKGEKCGFKVEPDTFRALQIGWGNGFKPAANSEDGHLKFRSALLEGTLTVTDPEKFRAALESGIGSGKAFGFGLLSVAPL